MLFSSISSAPRPAIIEVRSYKHLASLFFSPSKTRCFEKGREKSSSLLLLEEAAFSSIERFLIRHYQDSP